jgi:hypothetical protein
MFAVVERAIGRKLTPACARLADCTANRVERMESRPWTDAHQSAGKLASNGPLHR